MRGWLCVCVTAWIGLVLLPAVVAQPAPVDCTPRNGLHFICGPTASEDLVRIPDTQWLIASGMNVGPPAHLYLIDTRRKISSTLFPARAAESAAHGAPLGLGESDCQAAPDRARMSLDGLAMRRGPNGVHRLYAANHGDRMAIEIFAIDVQGERPKASWIGCARLPAHTLPNAVVAVAGDGLLVASPYDPTDASSWARMSRRELTGRVLEWHPGRGFALLPGSAMSGGNGIEVSADEKWVYASAWSASKLVVLARDGSARHEIALDFMPDNVHREPDGTLLVAGQRSTVERIRACTGAACPQPWVVVRVDPVRGTVRPLLAGNGDSTVSYACGALAVGGTLFVSARSDARVIYVPAPDR
jgi:hypothetical protein